MLILNLQMRKNPNLLPLMRKNMILPSPTKKNPSLPLRTMSQPNLPTLMKPKTKNKIEL